MILNRILGILILNPYTIAAIPFLTAVIDHPTVTLVLLTFSACFTTLFRIVREKLKGDQTQNLRETEIRTRCQRENEALRFENQKLKRWLIRLGHNPWQIPNVEHDNYESSQAESQPNP